MQRKLTFLASLLIALVLGACASPMQSGSALPPREFEPVRTVEAAFYPFTGDVAPTRFEMPTVWFVEVDGTPTVDGGSISTLSSAIGGVATAAADAGIAFTPRYVFSTFVTGFSAEVGPQDLLRLANLPGVKRVMPVGIVEAPQVERHDPAEVLPQLATALGMTGADVVHSGLGFLGTGIKVGIIDSGILRDHPEFGGRVTYGFDFVGDDYNANDPLRDVPVPEPGPSTRKGGGDCNGHGTHVAGIVGAGVGGTVTGVAPGVQLGAYRVFGCAGSTHSDVVLAAVERAFADGMDIVNLSLGSNNGWPQDFSSTSLSRMLEFGMIPVASAGNNGASGIYTIGSPGAGDHVITVASFDNVATALQRMVVAAQPMGYQNLTGAPPAPVAGTTAEIVYVGQGCNGDPYLAVPAGKVALITRGACNFSEKYLRAYDAGAVGVVIENNAAGNFAGTLGATSTLGFGITISGTNGASIKAAINALTSPTITWTDQLVSETNPTGNLISTFSSYGLAPDLSLKPDLGAPGGLIYSTMIDGAAPGVAGTAGYAVLSGTSMAAPHVAGAVALFLQGRPDIRREHVRDHLMNAAEPKRWSLDSGLTWALDSVHRQGAGMLRIDGAISSRTYALPAKLSLGESANGTYVDVITLHNDTAASVTYALTQSEELGFAPIATRGNSNSPGFDVAPPLVEYFKFRQSGSYDRIDQITVPAGGIASFQVRVTANPAAVQGTVYGTYLVFEPRDSVAGATRIRVPAAGIAGDYQQVPVINYMPALVVSYLGDLYLTGPGSSYTMRDEDIPYFVIGLAHAAELMTVEIVPQGARSWIGPQPAFRADLVRRNNPGGVAIYGLGDFDASGLPDGEYRFRIHLLKALGDPTNPAHRVMVETPNFFIARALGF
jgi:minor extracellular serine protease Vpr